MTKAITFDDFFKHAKFFYTTIGMEAYGTPAKSRLKTFSLHLIFYVSFINMNFVMLGEMIFATSTLLRGQDILKGLFTYSCAGFTIVGSFKIFCIWVQKSALNDFIRDIRLLFPEPLAVQKAYHLPQYFRRCLSITLGFSSLYMISVWIYNLLPLVQYTLYVVVLKEEGRKAELPYYMYIPWEWQGHWSYPLLYISMSLAGYTAASGHIASDLVLCAFATQLVMHYDYVTRAVRSYDTKDGQTGLDRRRAADREYDFLRNVIRYHSCLLGLSSRLNVIFGVSLFFNFASSTFVLCFVAFQMSVSADPMDLFKMCLFLLVLMSQVVLICHYSQQLIDASLNIADAVFNHSWYKCDLRCKEMLRFIIQRSQKAAQLKATTFIPISLTTITSLMQTSYNFFTLLRTMYVQK